MNNVPVGNAAIESTKGTIYQLYVAVEKCFEMTAGQQVFIERYGDVTLSNSQQIEVKHYADSLTDSHQNFWKTLENWLRPEFDEQKYSALVLCTTQPIGSDSKLDRWNQGDLTARLAIINKILQEAETRHLTRVNSTPAGKPIPAVSESLQSQRRVIQSTKLSEVIKRMVIASGSPDLTGLHARIKQVFCKGVLVGKQDDMCAALL